MVRKASEKIIVHLMPPAYWTPQVLRKVFWLTDCILGFNAKGEPGMRPLPVCLRALYVPEAENNPKPLAVRYDKIGGWVIVELKNHTEIKAAYYRGVI